MKVMMKELGEIITGNTPSKKTEEFWNSEDICFIKPDIIADNGINEIVDSNEYISEDARKKARVVGKNSIFITCIGNIGKLGIASDGEYAFNQQINAIIPNDRVQPKYLAYNLLFNKARLVAMANAPVVPIINKSQFGEFTVNIETDIDRQNETVDVLDKLTQIIQQRNKEISALDELIKARFVEMFGDPILNEKEWSCVMITDVCQLILGGGTPSKKCEEFFKGKIPWVTPKDMKQSIINDSIDHITEDAIVHSTTNLIPIWSVLMVIRSGILKHALPVAINSIPVTINQDMKAFIPGENITAEFLMYFFKAIEEDVLSKVRGVTADNIDFKTFQKREIIVPPMELQNQFAAFVTQVDKSKAAVQKALDETQLLFDSLMQKYFG